MQYIIIILVNHFFFLNLLKTLDILENTVNEEPLIFNIEILPQEKHENFLNFQYQSGNQEQCNS